MIRLLLKNDESIELRENTTLTITLNNPIFDRDSIDRVYTYSFRVGMTPKNRILLNQGQRLDNSFYFEQDGALLEIDGFPFDRGTLIAKDYSNGTALLSFSSATLIKLKDLEEIKINEICDTILIDQYFGYKIILYDEAEIYSIVVNNQVYESVEVDPAAAAAELVNLINADFPGVASTALVDGKQELDLNGSQAQQFIVNENLLKGMYILTKTFNLIGDQETNRQHVIDIQNNGVDTHAFPLVRFYDFYGGKNPGYDSIVNRTGANPVNQPDIGWGSVFVPFVRVKHIFDKAFKTIGIEHISGQFYELPDFYQLIIFNNYALDFIDPNLEANIHKNFYDLNEHVPNMTAREFVKRLFDSFGQYITLNGSTATIKFKKDQFVAPPIDWTGKSQPDYKKVPLDTSGFRLSIPEDETDRPNPEYSYQLKPFVFGNGARDIPLGFSVVYDEIVDITDIRTYRLIIARQRSQGSSDEYSMGQNPYPFKLFFERGLRTDSQGQSYPMATNGNLDVHENQIGNFTLQPNGEYGLFEYFFKGYIEYINNPTINKKVYLNIGDIFTLRKWDNALRTIVGKEGHLTGIVKSVTFKAHMNKTIDPADVEFIRYATN